MNFHQQLVLKNWMHRFFRGDDLQKLKERLGDDRYEGIEDGHTLFFGQLTAQLFDHDLITGEELARYDQNIVRHWQEITWNRNRKEGETLRMKYFQYLSLLFSEIYLDWYFQRPADLLAGLNEELAIYNEKAKKPELFVPYLASDLNKVAFWNATGSGKTLLLHVNLRQYLERFAVHKPNGKSLPDKIIVLTPNEGLSRQHLRELDDSGFGGVTLFDKDHSSLPGTIEIIDVNKLGDEMGDKIVAVEAFEGHNLVLVDEGHRGTGSEAGPWMRRRAALIGEGFAFEYSATFGQSVAKGSTILKSRDKALKEKAKIITGKKLKEITNEELAAISLDENEETQARFTATLENYAKCCLFDYSYKYFYDDEYGKEFTILNLPENKDTDARHLYFTACLLTFYQQLYLFETQKEELAEFNLEKPLWVFVGNKVNDDDSDILIVLTFIAQFLNDRSRTEQWIGDLLHGTARILDKQERNIFDKRFLPISKFSGAEIYQDILRRLFNTDSPQRLKLTNVKAVKGELALRVGSAEPFGLINIGDDSKFINQTADGQQSFDLESDEFGGSLFPSINKEESSLNLLIGSRKFTEGWSSWRVSTMGLLNMGTGAGPQIIQLFGRGVRLKGRNFTLKRTPIGERPKGLYLGHLQTINIFGVKATYMADFKKYLKEEGVTPTDELLELDFPIRPNLPATKLKTLGLKDGYRDNQRNGFKNIHRVELYEVPAEFIDQKTGKPKIKRVHTTLDLYPRIEIIQGRDQKDGNAAKRNEGKIPIICLKNFNWDRIYLAVQEHKMRQNWHNLRVDQNRLRQFCEQSQDWFTLFVPASEFELTNYRDLLRIEEVMITLLLDYTDRFYNALKHAYQSKHYEVITLNEDHGSMLKLYKFDIDDTDDGRSYLEQLKTLQDFIENGDLAGARSWNANQMIAICFDSHLYHPLIHLENKDTLPLKMRPLSFDAPSEVQFVQDLEAYVTSQAGKDRLGDKSLYLLRNASDRRKGVGFAVAGNFYPDFLLWLTCPDTGQQWLSFVDPKGLKMLDVNSPKFQLYREIKTVEKELKDTSLALNAFILSVTKYNDLVNITEFKTMEELEGSHILFMTDKPETYLDILFSKTLETFSAV